MGNDPRYKLYKFHKTKFWNRYESLNITPEFKSLVEKMTEHDPNKRAQMDQILNDPWMCGEMPGEEEFKAHFTAVMEIVKTKRESVEKDVDYQIVLESKRKAIRN